MKSDKILSNFFVLFVLYLILTFLIRLLLQFTPDSEFILYRFADHLKHGAGLFYGIPSPIVTTYPITPVLLLLPVNLVFALAVAAGGVLMIYILNGRWSIGLVYILLISVHNSTLAAVLLAFSLGAIAAAKAGNWIIAGILAAVAILTDGSAVIPAALLFFLAYKKTYMWRYAVPTFGIPLAIFLLARVATPDLTIVSVLPVFISVLVPVVALYAFIRFWKRLRDHQFSAVLVIWSGLVIAVGSINHSLPTAAALPGFLALIALLPLSLFGAVIGIVEFILLIGITPQIAIPQADKRIASGEKSAEQVVGEWLHTNIGEQDTLATSEIGALAYYADRPVIDLGGRLQPVDFDNTFFLRYGPSAIVLEKDEAVPWEPFKTTYAHTFDAGKYEVYQRVVRFSGLDEHPLNLVFTGNLRRDDLRLYSATVGNQVQSGDFVPVRLDWEFTYLPSYDTEIKLELVNNAGSVVASAVDTYKPEKLRSGRISTYHLLILPKETPEGMLSLNVTVGLRGGTLGTQKVADITVITDKK